MCVCIIIWLWWSGRLPLNQRDCFIPSTSQRSFVRPLHSCWFYLCASAITISKNTHLLFVCASSAGLALINLHVATLLFQPRHSTSHLTDVSLHAPSYVTEVSLQAPSYCAALTENYVGFALGTFGWASVESCHAARPVIFSYPLPNTLIQRQAEVT